MSADNLLVFEETEASANDKLTARNLAEEILKSYPGHLWAVNVDGEQGIWWIKNLSLSGNWGYIDKLGLVYSYSSMIKDALHHAGEILERFNQPRGAFSAQHWAELLLDTWGVPIGDKSGPGPSPPSYARPTPRAPASRAADGAGAESPFEADHRLALPQRDQFELAERDH